MGISVCQRESKQILGLSKRNQANFLLLEVIVLWVMPEVKFDPLPPWNLWYSLQVNLPLEISIEALRCGYLCINCIICMWCTWSMRSSYHCLAWTTGLQQLLSQLLPVIEVTCAHQGWLGKTSINMLYMLSGVCDHFQGESLVKPLVHSVIHV